MVHARRLEREKHEALTTQKDAMNRSFRVQLAKLVREKDDLARRLQHRHDADATDAAAAAAAAEVQKLALENALLRSDKKKREDQLQVRC